MRRNTRTEYTITTKEHPYIITEKIMNYVRLSLVVAAAALATSAANAQQYQQYQQVPAGYVLVPQGQATQGYAPQGYAPAPQAYAQQGYQQQPTYGQQAQDMNRTIGSLRGAVAGAQHGMDRGGLDGGLAAVNSILGFMGSQSQ